MLCSRYSGSSSQIEPPHALRCQRDCELFDNPAFLTRSRGVLLAREDQDGNPKLPPPSSSGRRADAAVGESVRLCMRLCNTP